MKNKDLIKLDHVTKNFGKTKALDNLSFSIPENSIFGFLGPNGSGKSTLMRILSGLIKKWEGKIFFENKNIISNQKYFLKQCGFLIENPTFYEYLSAHQNLSILAKITDCSLNAIDKALSNVELLDVAHKKVSDFSYGMKQRLGIAQAILHDPDILFLDEPNNGLDPLGIKEMNKTILGLHKKGKTICVSTHILNDVEELCSNIVILKEGNLILNSSMDDLLDKSHNIVIKGKEIHLMEKYLNSSTACKVIISEKEKLVIKTELDIHSISRLLPKNITIRSIAKEPNLVELFR